MDMTLRRALTQATQTYGALPFLYTCSKAGFATTSFAQLAEEAACLAAALLRK